MPISDQVCTTHEAAKLLGVSVTSVQQLVESGALEAWKTKGGHRRIPLAAVQAFKSESGNLSGPLSVQAANSPTLVPPEPAPAEPVSDICDVLIVEDNPIQCDIYEKQIGSWDLPVALSFSENGYKALIQIARRQPDILLVDIVMQGIDGYEVINTVLSFDEFANTNIAILSNLTREDLDQRGGLPPGVSFFPKPVNYDELKGFLRACCAQKARAVAKR
jgi:excisionase family DNA binding protein